MEQLHGYIDGLALALELAGVGVIVLGVVLASVRFVRDARASGAWPSAYDRYRANLGRGILLGLELLVGADIIGTITAPLTASSVALLAAIVLIRTFLSFSLETEIEGCWPWQRHKLDKADPSLEREREAALKSGFTRRHEDGALQSTHSPTSSCPRVRKMPLRGAYRPPRLILPVAAQPKWGGGRRRRRLTEG